MQFLQNVGSRIGHNSDITVEKCGWSEQHGGMSERLRLLSTSTRESADRRLWSQFSSQRRGSTDPSVGLDVVFRSHGRTSDSPQHHQHTADTRSRISVSAAESNVTTSRPQQSYRTTGQLSYGCPSWLHLRQSITK